LLLVLALLPAVQRPAWRGGRSSCMLLLLLLLLLL